LSSNVPAFPKPTPEQLLSEVEANETDSGRGRLKVFLGYASGVGKSFKMLDEGRRRRERGQDIVIGATQPESPPALDELIGQIEVIPLRTVAGIPVIDVERLLQRHPEVCLVDGLAYDNPPISRNRHRWEDVEQLLSAGISVLTTLNLQYVAERQRQLQEILGKSAVFSVPESFLRKADEIVVVDAPAGYCTNRPQRTNPGVLPAEKERILSQLREIALLFAAEVVDEQLEAYLARRGVRQLWGTQERILVCLTPQTNAARMIARARLTRDRFHGELFVVYVGRPNLSSDDQIALERNLHIAREAGAVVKLLDGEDEVNTIMDFARKEGITQIFIGHSITSSWRARFTRTTADRLIRAAEGIDVKLFPN
jgi:two-component system sensor histidine kinase KdpD